VRRVAIRLALGLAVLLASSPARADLTPGGKEIATFFFAVLLAADALLSLIIFVPWYLLARRRPGIVFRVFLALSIGPDVFLGYGAIQAVAEDRGDAGPLVFLPLLMVMIGIRLLGVALRPAP
jgi:hypothetical protein